MTDIEANTTNHFTILTSVLQKINFVGLKGVSSKVFYSLMLPFSGLKETSESFVLESHVS